MRIIYFLGLLNLVIITTAPAQVKFGIGGGAHKASVIETNSLNGWDNLYKSHFSSRNGYHFGIFTEIPLDARRIWGVQINPQFFQKGRNFSKSYDSILSNSVDTSQINATWKLNYVELPVNLVLRAPISRTVRLVIGGGPYVSYLFKKKSTYEVINSYGEKSNYTDRMPVGNINTYQSLDYGVNALIGLDIDNRLLVTGNFSNGFADFYKADYEGSFKNRTYGATVVLWLNKVRKPKEAPVKQPIIITAKDSDQDGLLDSADACPSIAGTIATKGCPDKDADGIADKDDQCVDIAGLQKYNGCPVPDTDGDGINDEQDSCRLEKGLALYNGCPVPDTDKDGVKDDEDACPKVPGELAYKGCPAPDTDGDGVADNKDKCPQIAGLANNNGCPSIEEEVRKAINKAAKKILYSKSSDLIRPESYKSLNDIADILKKYPNLKMDIEGHTDNTGSVRFNQVLSGKRALAIKNYLIRKGVKSDRITATGFGSSKPIATNTNEAGRSRNRRVELKIRF